LLRPTAARLSKGFELGKLLVENIFQRIDEIGSRICPPFEPDSRELQPTANHWCETKNGFAAIRHDDPSVSGTVVLPGLDRNRRLLSGGRGVRQTRDDEPGCLGGLQRRLTSDDATKRRILEIVFLNCRLEGATLCPTIRKPFDVLAEGLLVQSSRGDRTSIELFSDSFSVWTKSLIAIAQALAT
jgi:hypothetical protein